MKRNPGVVADATQARILALLKKVMMEFCPPLVVSKDEAGSFEVTGNIPTPYGAAKKIIPGMFFACTVLRNTNVSFYYFPMYLEPKEYEKMAPNAMQCLDGKTCFHFRKEEQVMEKEIRDLMKKGLAYYRKKGWVK